jgi:DNA-binding LacI/PurR family transcriptional regulator
MAANGLEPILAPAGDWTPDAGYASAREVLRNPSVTAVFTANDEMAVGLLAAAAEAGIDVPGRLSVVGFDDIPTAKFLSPPLTTIEQDFGELGRRTIAALIDEIEHGASLQQHPALTSRLIVRSSTAMVTNRIQHVRVG